MRAALSLPTVITQFLLCYFNTTLPLWSMWPCTLSTNLSGLHGDMCFVYPGLIFMTHYKISTGTCPAFIRICALCIRVCILYVRPLPSQFQHTAILIHLFLLFIIQLFLPERWIPQYAIPCCSSFGQIYDPNLFFLYMIFSLGSMGDRSMDIPAATSIALVSSIVRNLKKETC